MNGPARSDSIVTLQHKLRDFARDRDWDQFHTPRNLATAMTVETAELLELFQWDTSVDSNGLTDERLSRVREEVADVFLYLIRLCDKLEIDIFSAAEAKIAANGLKYPVEKAKGNSKKYSEL